MATSIVVVVGMLVTIALPASAAEPQIVLGRSRIGEFQPVRGDRFLAWQQNTRRDPGHYDVYARPAGGGQAFRVNAQGTNGANGGIDGDLLVYQQFRGENSDLKFFDLSDRQRRSPPSGVNTDQWEYWPSISGDWLLFGRAYGSGVRRLFLFDLSDRTARRLDTVRGAKSFLAPGQVSGEWAVWATCRSARACDVVRYHIPDGDRDEIPNPGGRQGAPSVAPDGTVYFARSRGGCGSGVRLMSRPLAGEASVLWRLPGGDDVGTTRVYVDQEGSTSLFYDHFACGRAADSDAWRLAEDGAPSLSVELEGNGSGDVTSSPAGINCGSDCSESYPSGTGVTLTAEPDDGSAFAGWSGACTGTNLTCTLTMDGSRNAIATFSNRPVLTVTTSGNGQGTVTSSPAGISCGGDCSQPYDTGTSVTLTAAPDAGSTFGGWSGDCGGMVLTCTVTMNGSRSVTATFSAQPTHQLTVSTTGGDGTGTVTSNPGGINCGADCQETYPQGTDVTLTAAADPSMNFTGWSGDCSGMNLTCTVTMNGARSVTATFDDPLLILGSSGLTLSDLAIARRLIR